MASSSPSPQQQFCLRWNNHQSALVSVFDHLLQSEAFVDVTLAVEGLLLRAHKLVLSACSPYFQAMFASHPAKHPIIILKDVRYGDLRALLDFMYKGEVAVDQDRLPAFLRLAESLKIRGLAEFCEESLSHQAESSSSQPPIFDSLLDSQKRSHHPSSSSAGQMNHQSAAAVTQQQQHSNNNNQTPPAGIELLPLSSQQQHQQQQRQTAAGLDFSVPTGLGLFHGSPLALAAAAAAAAAANSNNTPRSSSSLSSSTKRPSSPQTYAHHRRKRGRPPRQSYSESAGNLYSLNTGLIANKSNSSKDVRGSSPEVMEMNVDLLSMGSADAASSAPTNSSAHDSSASSKNHENNKEGASPSPRSNSSPHLTSNATTTTNSALIKRETPSLLLIEPDTRPDQHDVTIGSDPQPGTSHQQMNFDISRRGGKSAGIKTMKRARGRPRGFGRNATSLDRASMLGGAAGADSLALDDSSLAGPSSVNQRDGSTPDRTLLGNSGGGSNSNNTEQLQEMSIRGLNLFRYASVSEEGMYRCIPCEKEHVTRTFKNKYSFQRHAYLYHEGNQRKVFPCLVCGREFSRPDKLKHHLKSVHDYAVSREYSNAYYALP